MRLSPRESLRIRQRILRPAWERDQLAVPEDYRASFIDGQTIYSFTQPRWDEFFAVINRGVTPAGVTGDVDALQPIARKRLETIRQTGQQVAETTLYEPLGTRDGDELDLFLRTHLLAIVSHRGIERLRLCGVCGNYFWAVPRAQRRSCSDACRFKKRGSRAEAMRAHRQVLKGYPNHK